jgi:hypothetical protein
LGKYECKCMRIYVLAEHLEKILNLMQAQPTL